METTVRIQRAKKYLTLLKVKFFPVYIVYNSAMITYAKITGAINLHFIGAHVRFFHSVSRVELAIQLCVGQRRVWYASWIPQKKKSVIQKTLGSKFDNHFHVICSGLRLQSPSG